MGKQYNLILWSDPIRLAENLKGFENEKDIAVAFASAQMSEVMSFAASRVLSNPVFIRDCAAAINTEEAALVALLKDKRIPIVAIAANANEGFKMLEAGAADMMVRKSGADGDADRFFYRMFAVRIREAASKQQADPARVLKHPNTKPLGKIVAIGSSTGGTETLTKILQQMPADAPPILVVQHMPPVFTKLYAERVNALCAVSVWEARDGDALSNGLVLIAPGDFHMVLTKSNDSYRVACIKGEKVCNQRPSVDVLFDSVAQAAGAQAVGVILTGMGSDGAKGLLNMRSRGAYTIGQDEESSVVYGMPRMAYECGAVMKQLHLDLIPKEILKHI